jgi:putative hydrolase of the HAD superfamily
VSHGLLIFDGDDTLWATEPLYDRARTGASKIAETVGIDPVQFERVQREIDARNVLTMGLSALRFPTSSVDALRKLAEESDTPLDPSLVRRVYAASEAVFEACAPLLPNAAAVLSQLRGSYALALCTKGDEWVQNRRIDDSGLRGYFDVVAVVPTKDAGTFRALLQQFEEAPNSSVSIGNSMPSDIAPALELGMHAIWIDAHVWSHERRAYDAPVESPLLHIARDLAEIPAILARASLQST